MININQTILAAASESPPWADYALRRVVKAVNDSRIEMAITLSSGSIVIKGTLIAIDAYYDHLAVRLADVLNESADLRRTQDELKEAGNSLPYYIHLKNSAIFVGGSQTSISGEGLWRGAISSINGYSLG
ncbi:hypothetical protein [Pseudomonas sp. Irchel 3E20]|uniref:hypothetical protein n=1 Tax=Pseudomonas sp. Irchel 3E20 TaxID=2008983 RepID=UPI0011407CDE|nr:hypothetical protein [Pseudomonas sp. Irchel 3E20]